MDPINLRYLNILEVTVNMGYTRLKKTVRGVASPSKYLFGLKIMYKIPIFYQFSLGF